MQAVGAKSGAVPELDEVGPIPARYSGDLQEIAPPPHVRTAETAEIAEFLDSIEIIPNTCCIDRNVVGGMK
jgi:hypothetical protein